MIATKGAARFHANNDFSSPGRPSAGTTTANPILGGGTKRPLASCREELERSWGAMPATDPADPQDLHRISSASSSEEFTAEYDNCGGGRVKRRRTLQWQNCPDDDEDDMMMEEETGSFVRGTRISPTNRPFHPNPADGTVTTKAKTRPQVKAGWYEGGIDSHGNRHGRGITKHDDGTEYEGPYALDVMVGPDGRYQFVTTRHLVPNPQSNGSHLHRSIERSFVGNFLGDAPHGAGMIVTKTVDAAPQVLGSAPIDVRFAEITYDVGVHRNGVVTGEGMRIVYTTTNEGGRSTLSTACNRLVGGEVNVRVNVSYARWMLTCMDFDFPEPPTSV